MPDILVVKCNAFLPHEKMQAILDNLMAQKETGVFYFLLIWKPKWSQRILRLSLLMGTANVY